MRITQIDETVFTGYRGASWAIAVLAGETVIGAIYIDDHPDEADVAAICAELKSRDIFKKAAAAADKAFDLVEAIDPDEEGYERASENFSAKAVTIRGGMMGSREFSYLHTAKERAILGVENDWF